MDYFSNLQDEANISAKYENQLNLLNSQKNERAEELTTLKNQYADELYSYGLDKANQALEKLDDVKSLIETGIDVAGLQTIKGITKLPDLYKGSDLEYGIDEGISGIKSIYSNLTAPGVKGLDTPPEQEGMELENLTGRIENQAVEPGSEFPSAGLTQADTGSVGGVTEATEQAVDTENQEASAFNSEITSDIDRGELTARSPDDSGAGEMNTDTAAEANSELEQETSSGIADGTSEGESLASDAVSSLTDAASSAASDVASSAAEGLAGLGATEAAENALDFTGIGEALAVGSLITAGIKSFVDWLDPPAPPPPPPPPQAPKFMPLAEAPTFISSQVQAGI